MINGQTTSTEIIREIVRLFLSLRDRGFKASVDELTHRQLLLADYLVWLDNRHDKLETLPRPLVGVGAMIVRNDKILLGRRTVDPGAQTYGWCGGHLEYGESLENCARREVKEETGLEVSSASYLCISEIVDPQQRYHYIDIEYQVEVKPGEPTVVEPEKVEDWNWYRFDNLPTPLFKACDKAIAQYLVQRLSGKKVG